jgi:glycosyltransferase involved in cell wall biosynthesis
MNRSPGFITACIPTFKCTKYIRHSVQSLLNQTYPYLRIIVINDGDPEPPWRSLADISDPRLIRFNLPENRGPYFALAVALEATPDSFFLVQDADDWSPSHRVATLLQMLRRDNSQYAFSTLAQFCDHHLGGIVPSEPMFAAGPDTDAIYEFRNRMPHVGLFSTQALRQLGGYYGGFKFGYDMLLTSLFLLAGRVSWTPEWLYWRRLRPTSLSHAPDTGWKSNKRRQVRAEMRELYHYAYRDYESFVRRQISGTDFLGLLRWRVAARRCPSDERRISDMASGLRRALREQARHLR